MHLRRAKLDAATTSFGAHTNRSTNSAQIWLRRRGWSSTHLFGVEDDGGHDDESPQVLEEPPLITCATSPSRQGSGHYCRSRRPTTRQGVAVSLVGIRLLPWTRGWGGAAAAAAVVCSTLHKS
nr:unnamed protein product [Digitaria exilis]